VGTNPLYKVIGLSSLIVLINTANRLLYCSLWVTAIRARAKSRGYVADVDTTPANDPAIKVLPGCAFLSIKSNSIRFQNSDQLLRTRRRVKKIRTFVH